MLPKSGRTQSCWRWTSLSTGAKVFGVFLLLACNLAFAQGEDAKKVIPEDAPQWVRESPTRMDSGMVRFPVRITSEADRPSTESQFQELLAQEIRSTLSEMSIGEWNDGAGEERPIDVGELVESFPDLTAAYIARNWLNRDAKFDSESEFGGVRLRHQWRLVEIPPQEIAGLAKKQTSLAHHRHLRSFGILGILALVAISGCAALGAKWIGRGTK